MSDAWEIRPARPDDHAAIVIRALHRRLGFEVTGPVADYDRPGQERMLFCLDT